MYDLFVVNPKKHWHGTTASLIFSIIKIVGFVFLIIIELNILFGVTNIPLMGWFMEPLEGIGNRNLANFIMSNTLVSITISIPTAARSCRIR